MKARNKLVNYRLSLVLRTVALSCATMFASANAQDQSTKVDTNAPTPAQRALALLKPAADKLSSAKAFTFKAHNMVEVPSPVGQTINYFFVTDVAVQRPNKLKSKKSGDGPAFDLYYNGKQLTGVDEKLKLFARLDAPATLDELIPFAVEKADIYFPYADVLFQDVYGSLTKDLTNACWVEKSAVDGVNCDHLAFASPGVEWQIWVGPEKEPLPRRLAVTYVSMERQPRFLVTFTDWNLKSSLPDKQFEYKKPEGAKQIAFRPLPQKTDK